MHMRFATVTSLISAALIAVLSSAAMLFLHQPGNTSIHRFMPRSTIQIEWGEGSEAGVPENVIQKH